MPLCIRRQQHRFGAVRVLGYPLDDWGTSYGPIGSNRAVAMLAAMQHLRHADRDWDLMELRWTSPPWSDDARAARSMRVVGMSTEQQARSNDVASSISPAIGKSYLAAKSRKTRHEIRRVLRRTFEKENVTYIRHRPAPARDGDGDPAWDLYAMCQQVALASWQGSSTTGNTITHDRVRHFLRDAHAVAARLGMVDMNLLLVDGRPAAFTYNYYYRGRVTCCGWDTTRRSLSAASARAPAAIDPGQLRARRRIVRSWPWRFTASATSCERAPKRVTD